MDEILVTVETFYKLAEVFSFSSIFVTYEKLNYILVTNEDDEGAQAVNCLN